MAQGQSEFDRFPESPLLAINPFAFCAEAKYKQGMKENTMYPRSDL
jgi:hypothetical protein